MAIAALGAGCSEDLEEKTQTGSRNNEIQLVFSGADGENQEYTKSIASESENEIGDLKVYLFASDATDGTYYYLETWTEGTAYDKGNPTATNFQKKASGTSWVSSIYPNELKGLPYIKLMCVANNAGGVTDGKFYDASNGEILTPLTAVTVDANGTVENAAAATTEAAFKAAFTKYMQNTPGGTEDIIRTPLLMTGSGQVKISGSVSKVTIDMKRIVARFDIDNTSTKSQLTIETITLANARKNGSLWGTTLTGWTSDDERTANLMTYADITYTDFVGANQGMVESAIYTYPGLTTDESYLIIKGKYKSPIPGAGNLIDVTYNVPIQKTEGEVTTPIAIQANNRYKLRITDVTQSNIYASFEVVDWISGGGIHVKPDNDAPVFDEATGIAVVTGDAPTAIVGAINSFKLADNTEKFNLTVAATGKVRAETAPAFTKSATDWLTVGEASYEEKDGIWYTQFPVTIAEDANKQPINVTFINETASFDPDLWTTLTFYGPSEAPILADGGNNSLGNTVEADGATMYNVVNGFINVKAWCVEGTTVELPSGDKFEQIGKPVTDGYYTTFTFKIKAELDQTSYDFTFKNTGDNSKTKTFTVTKTDVTTTATLGDDVSNYAELADNGNGAYDVTTDTNALSTNTYTLKISAAEDVSVELPNGKWLKVIKEKFEGGVASFKVSLNSAATKFDDFEIVFVNKLDATSKATVTMKKKTI